MKYALDTNAYADWKKGIRWIREIAEADEIHFSTVVLGELSYGFACGAREQKNLNQFDIGNDSNFGSQKMPLQT